jgi:hypothetical protein
MAMESATMQGNAIVSQATQDLCATTSAQIFAAARASALTADVSALLASSVWIAPSNHAAVAMATAPFLVRVFVVQDGWAINAKLECSALTHLAAVMDLAPMATARVQLDLQGLPVAHRHRSAARAHPAASVIENQGSVSAGKLHARSKHQRRLAKDPQVRKVAALEELVVGLQEP